MTAIAVAALLAAPEIAGAQGAARRVLGGAGSGRSAPYRLIYDHLAPRLEFRNASGNTVVRGEERQELHLTMPAGRPVVVELRNANALLYRYEVKVEVAQERDLHACSRSAGRFVQQSFFIGVAAFQGREPPAPLTTKAIEERLRALATSATRTRGEERLTPADAARLIGDARSRLREYVDFSATVSALSRELTDSLAWIAEFAEWRPADSLLASVHASVRDRHPELGAAGRVAEVAAERQQRMRPGYGALVRVTHAIESGAYTGSPHDSIAKEAVSLRHEVESAHARLDSAYRRLQFDLDLLETARALATQEVVLPPSDDVRRVSVVIEPTTHFPSVVRLRQGRASATLSGERSWACRLSIGFAMAEPTPDYKVEDTRIIDASSGRQRFTPTLLVHVSPSTRPVGALLGIGPGTGDAPNVYAGMSWSLFGDFFVNAGAVWRRTPELPAGFRTGQVVDPETFPGSKHRMKLAVFLGASLSQ